MVDLFRHFSPRPVRRNWNQEIKRCSRVMASGPELNALDRGREISVRELAQLKEPPLFVDVRGEDEYFCGHIEGERNLSRAVLEHAAFATLPERAKPIVVYCARGASSALAAELLLKAGYLNVFSLNGGLFGWLEAGGTLETRKKG